MIPKTPPGLSKSQRRKWREEQREKREKRKEDDKKMEILRQIRENREQARRPSPAPRAGIPRYPSPFEAARPASPKMSQSRRLFSPTSTRSSLGYASRARNGHDSSSSDEEFGLAAARDARARKFVVEVGFLLLCCFPIGPFQLSVFNSFHCSLSHRERWPPPLGGGLASRCGGPPALRRSRYLPHNRKARPLLLRRCRHRRRGHHALRRHRRRQGGPHTLHHRQYEGAAMKFMIF